MMKNLRKNALISLVIVLATVLLLARGVNASGDLLATPGGNTATTNTANVLQDNTTNTATNVASNLTSVNNVQKVNNINDASKDIPQTGENDIYVITVIGLAAVVIGGIAFAKSKKYDI